MNNIIIEDNLLKVTKHSTIFKFDEDKLDDMIAQTEKDITVLFKSNDEVYPNGKVIRSDESIVKYDYNYRKDSDGNIVGCVVTKSNGKNGKSLDINKISEKRYFDSKGNLTKEELYTRDGIMYCSHVYKYNCLGKVIEQTDKGTQTITVSKFNNNGQLINRVNTTIKSGARHVKYDAKFDSKGNLIYYIDGDRNIQVYIERDCDIDDNVLSITKRFFKISNPKKLISTHIEIFDPNADFKISQVIKNGFLVERYFYDLKGGLVKMWLKEDQREITKRVSETIEEETGNKIVETRIFIENYNGTTESKIIKETYDIDGKLLVYAENNSMITEYTYNEDGKRLTAITKQLVNEEFIKVNEINYSYTTDEETCKKTQVREEIIYNEKGEVTHKQIHTESTSDTEKEYTVENREYDIKSDCNCNKQ